MLNRSSKSYIYQAVNTAMTREGAYRMCYFIKQLLKKFMDWCSKWIFQTWNKRIFSETYLLSKELKITIMKVIKISLKQNFWVKLFRCNLNKIKPISSILKIIVKYIVFLTAHQSCLLPYLVHVVQHHASFAIKKHTGQHHVPKLVNLYQFQRSMKLF